MTDEILNVIRKNKRVKAKRKIKAKAKISIAKTHTTKRSVLAKAFLLENQEARAAVVLRQEDTMVQNYKSLGSVNKVREFWTSLLETSDDKDIDVDDNKIIKSMIAMMTSDMDRYVKYAALEKANKRRLNPSKDLTGLSENIMNYLKDLMQIIKGVDFGDPTRNARQVFLIETLNVFKRLEPNAKKEFEQFIDAEIEKGPEKGTE